MKNKTFQDFVATQLQTFDVLTFTALWANSADGKLMISFFIFPQKAGFNISSKLSPLETICMKCQNLFLVNKNNNNISTYLLLKNLPRMLSVKGTFNDLVYLIRSLYPLFPAPEVFAITNTCIFRLWSSF